jgi:regulator of nucleoside diphosphate kinase
MTKAKSKSVPKPRILITTTDLENLSAMVGAAPTTAGAILLADELDRATVVNEGFNARTFCRVGSRVTYEDLDSGQTREIELVLPADADIDKQRVSVLSLVGASLLGLTIGAEFKWTDEKGRPHRLKVLDAADVHEPRVH